MIPSKSTTMKDNSDMKLQANKKPIDYVSDITFLRQLNY